MLNRSICQLPLFPLPLPPHPPPLQCVARTGNPTEQHITYAFQTFARTGNTAQLQANNGSPTLPVRATPQTFQEQLGPPHPPPLQCFARTGNGKQQHITNTFPTVARTGNTTHHEHTNSLPTLPVRATHSNTSAVHLSMARPYGQRLATRTQL